VSQDTSPVHTFPGNGVYEVCLTVGNENGSDTACKQVVIGTTGVDEELEMLALRLYPNPARSSIYFHWNLPEGIENAIISITDLQGKLLDTIEITGQKGKQEWSVEQLEHGVYTCRLKLPDGNTQTSKLTVIK
jgi:PKD repeat protein